jgi:hypothetical protein
MPDITMCGTEDCPLKSRCYRSPASGTRPTEWRQSWSAFRWQARPLNGAAAAKSLFSCDNFVPSTKEASDA